MKKSILNTKTIAEIAIFAAIAFILDFLQEKVFNFVPFFANGGSIGFAMVPIILIGLRRGILCGSLCGLVTSLCQMLGGITAINSSDFAWYQVFIQVMLDYLITYLVVGLFSGIFYHFINEKKSNKNNILFISLATFLGGFAKFICHFLSGLIFWQGFEIFNMPVTPAMYSFIYNGLYCFPNIVLCLIVLIIIYLKQSKLFYINHEVSQ